MKIGCQPNGYKQFRKDDVLQGSHNKGAIMIVEKML